MSVGNTNGGEVNDAELEGRSVIENPIKDSESESQLDAREPKWFKERYENRILGEVTSDDHKHVSQQKIRETIYPDAIPNSHQQRSIHDILLFTQTKMSIYYY